MEPSEQSGPDLGLQDVNPVFLQQLRELDIPEEAAKQVGQHTKGEHNCLSIKATFTKGSRDILFLWHSSNDLREIHTFQH